MGIKDKKSKKYYGPKNISFFKMKEQFYKFFYFKKTYLIF